MNFPRKLITDIGEPFLLKEEENDKRKIGGGLLKRKAYIDTVPDSKP